MDMLRVGYLELGTDKDRRSMRLIVLQTVTRCCGAMRVAPVCDGCRQRRCDRQSSRRKTFVGRVEFDTLLSCAIISPPGVAKSIGLQHYMCCFYT
jgi:hypothetical protein